METKIIELYLAGKTMHQVAYYLGISYSTVQRYIKKNGLSRNNKQLARKYDLNHAYFHAIDTEEKSYWLGFFFADGYVTKSKKQKQVGIALSSSDREHLEKFKSSIRATYNIKEYTTISYGVEVKYSRLLMTSDTMFDDLVSKGATERKSLTLTFPSSVPDKLIQHFIRGYFDGDGSWSLVNGNYKFRLCGTKEMLDSISVILGFGIRKLYKRHKDEKNNWSLEIGGNLQAKKISNFLYHKHTICLQRKFDIVREL